MQSQSLPTGYPWEHIALPVVVEIGPFSMKAGKYYVGDLCYVLGNKAHGELCKKCFPEGNSTGIEGKSVLSDGRIVISFICPDGDGAYEDQNGLSYMVDSGWLGITLLEGLEGQWDPRGTKKETMVEYIGRPGHIVDHDSEFNVKSVSVDGVVHMTFGDKVTIDTGLGLSGSSSDDDFY